MPHRSRMTDYLLLALKTAALGYLAILAIITLLQRSLYYRPERSTTFDADRTSLREGLVRWTNGAGATLGWRRPAPHAPASWSVLVFHGNAGNALGRDYLGRPIGNALNADVFLVEYPGFADLPGAPSQTSLLAQADAALASVPVGAPIAVVSESMGTGPAAHLAAAASEKVAAFCFLVPFNRLTDVAAAAMPWLPVRLLMFDRYPAQEWVGNCRRPAVFVLAGEDSVIPNRFGRSLHDAWPRLKKLSVIDGLDHNDVVQRPENWWREVGSFWSANGASGRPIP
jgi:uncharacterized protein